MFASLNEKLTGVFDRLTGRGALSEEQVKAALREIRIALLEADVALPVVKDFIAAVQERAVGQDVLRAVAPGQQVVKIVHDALVEMLSTGQIGTATANDAPPVSGSGNILGDNTLNLAGTSPAIILLAGLQGAGKTTTAAKLALFLQNKNRKKVLMASLDIYRPAAQEQLATLGTQYSIDTLPIIPEQRPADIAKRALEAAKLGGYDAVIWDTAGRQSLDQSMMAELADLRTLAQRLSAGEGHALETLLVADSMTGQDAVRIAKGFTERIAITGVILTRVDGDARGGAALSMLAVTQAPIKFLGVGEKADALEAFHADRIASRILGMGDVVSLVEKASETVDREQAAKLVAKMQKGRFDLDDYADQLQQMRKMGGLKAILGMLPGMGAMKHMGAAAGAAGLDEASVTRQIAIIHSMTQAERGNAGLLNASRRRRIATGSGTEVRDVNRLIKQFQDMQTMMKRMQNGGLAGMMRGLSGKMGGMLPTLPSGVPGVGNAGLPNLQDFPPDMQEALRAGGAMSPFGAGSGKFRKFKKKIRRK